MHFRARNNVVQLIRTTYDADKKRARSEVIGNVARSKLTLADDVAAKMTPEEKQQFETFALNYRNAKTLQGKAHAFQISDIMQEVIAAAEASEGAEREAILSNLTIAAMDIRGFLNRQAKA